MSGLVCLGEILIDFTPCGKNSQGMALFAQNPGGAPANVLAMNAKLGGRSAFIGKVGADAFGTFLKQTLESLRIDTTGLVTNPEIPTTLAFVQLDAHGDRSFTFYRKPGADLRLTWEDVCKERIAQCDIFHFGSLSLTDEPCRSATLNALRYAKSLDKTISFDPNYRPLLWQDLSTARHWMTTGLREADIVKVSEEEMTLLTGETDPETGSLRLLEMGPQIVLVTLGADGSYYRNAAGHGRIPACKVHTVDTTGAGDAFMGAMLWQLNTIPKNELANTVLSPLVTFANAAGGLTTTKPGAIPALPTLADIQSSLNK